MTDADVVLGYLNADALLAGAMRMDRSLAVTAIERHVCGPLGLELLRAAHGIVEIVNVKMAQAIKAISTERGFDIRSFTLVPFGGAGPVHACRIALDLGLPRLLIPPAPGVTSALGLLMADVKHDFLRSRLEDISVLEADRVNDLFEELRTRAYAQLEAEGFTRDTMQFRYFLDMRYAGQGYENPVPLDGVPLGEGDLARYRSKFDDIHRKCHGHAAVGQPVEVVNYRLEAIGVVPRIELPRVEGATGTSQDAKVGERNAYFPSLSPGLTATAVYSRDKLLAGHRIDGPALIDQYDSTIVVCPEQSVTVDDFANLLVERVR